MAARRKSVRGRKTATGRRGRRSSLTGRLLGAVRKALPAALLGTGILLGIGIGFGLALLPGAPERSVEPNSAAQPIQPSAGQKTAAQKPALNEVAIAPQIPAQAPVPVPQPLPKPIEPTETYVASVTAPVALPASTPVSTAAPPPAEPVAELASLPPETSPLPGELPLWRRNAATYVDPGEQPMIAIVLDDVGVAPAHARDALQLPAPIVLSIMTYADKAAIFAEEGRRRGHEVMVHMPMQPMSASVNAGPNALTVGLDAAEIRRRVDWGLTRFQGYVGFNNHMGSRFTQDEAGMRAVLEEAKARGLLFLDSKTIAGSVGDRLAAEMGVTHIARDVFLDDTLTEAAVARQLASAEAIARKKGYAVAIGHPHPATIAVLKRWLPAAAARGIVIVPLTTIVMKRDGVAG
jgi:polysaccharide deacetylase 2 family uncharacterized protein YibQ